MRLIYFFFKKVADGGEGRGVYVCVCVCNKSFYTKEMGFMIFHDHKITIL